MVVQRGCGILFCDAPSQFPMSVADRSSIPDTDFHTGAIESVGGSLKKVRSGRDGRISVVGGAVERLVATKIVEDGDLSAACIDADGDSELVSLI